MAAPPPSPSPSPSTPAPPNPNPNTEKAKAKKDAPPKNTVEIEKSVKFLLITILVQIPFAIAIVGCGVWVMLEKPRYSGENNLILSMGVGSLLLILLAFGAAFSKNRCVLITLLVF
ncbi:hypothetical protein PFISCL1PPCAC_1209, partial [Pristionchus fissidentatus]